MLTLRQRVCQVLKSHEDERAFHVEERVQRHQERTVPVERTAHEGKPPQTSFELNSMYCSLVDEALTPT